MTEQRRKAHLIRIAKCRAKLAWMRQRGLSESTATDYVFRLLAINAKREWGYAQTTDPCSVVLGLSNLWRMRRYWESDRCEKISPGGEKVTGVFNRLPSTPEGVSVKVG